MKSRDIVVVTGKTGHGKSVWVRRYCETISRLFVYDPVKEFPVSLWLNAEEIVDAYDTGECRDAFKFGTYQLEDLDIFAYLAFISGNCCLVIDEASNVFTRGQRLSGWARELVFLGRHRGVSLIITAQRAASIPIEIRSQATRFISFAQHEQQDLRWLQDCFGEDAFLLPTFKPLECLDTNNGRVARYTLTI